jgi:hypothetical protein
MSLLGSFVVELGEIGVIGVLCGSGDAGLPDGGVGGIGGIWYLVTLVLMGLKLLIFLAWLVWGTVTGGGCTGCAKICGGGIGETGEKGNDRGMSRGDIGETGGLSLCA